MKRVVLLLVLTSLISCSVKHDFPTFSYHKIDNIGKGMGQTGLIDMDKDGDLDWAVGEAPWGGSRLWWFEYQSADTWVRHDIGIGNTDVGGDWKDIDGNGWIDYWGGSVMFLKQGDGNFERFELNTMFSHDSQLEDINGDGKLDGIANSDKYGLAWYSIPDDPTQPWQEHMIASVEQHKIHGGVGPNAVGDLDGDGDPDVVTGQAWYENVDGAGQVWKQHKNIDFGEEHKYGIALKTWVLDLDNDGDNDFVQAEADNPDSRVAWFENDGKGEWTRHIIKDKGDGQDFHSLAIADFDNDGDMDVFSGGGPLSSQPQKGYIWENTGKAIDWIEHVVVEKPCHESVAADVDGDGDIDICSKPWNVGDEHFYLQNLLK